MITVERINTIENIKKTSYKTIQSCIKNNEKINGILQEIYLQIIKVIFKNLDYEIHFTATMIQIDFQFWVNVHQKSIIKQYPDLVNNVIKIMKVLKICTKQSKQFIINKMININPLPSSFVYLNAPEYDRIMKIKQEFINDETLDLHTKIYIYLKLFFPQTIPNDYFRLFYIENFFQLLKYSSIIVLNLNDADSKDNFAYLKTYVLDSILTSWICQLKDNNKPIFKESIRFYSNALKRFQKENSLRITPTRRANDFSIQKNHSPLLSTLLSYKKYPYSSLLEIDKKYPNIISHELLEIERKNYSLYKENLSNNPKVQIDTSNVKSSKLYEKLKLIKEVPKNPIELEEYLEYWYQFISKYKDEDEKLKSILEFLKLELHRIDKQYRVKPILAKTLHSYLQVLFDYCFDFIVVEESIEAAIVKIVDNLKESAEKKVRQYLIDQHNTNTKGDKSIIHYSRSMIFEDELDSLNQKLHYQDKKEYKNSFFYNQRAVFSILAYYTGLRKSELLSRMTKDIYHINNHTFVIDVNDDGFEQISKYLIQENSNPIFKKNDNAKRRVEFTIPNTKHFNLVKKYLNIVEDHQLKFLFPDITCTNKISKTKAIKFKKVDQINDFLKKVTARHSVIHGFRHTFITNEVLKILTKKNKKIKDIFDLIVRIGHHDFTVSLNSYAHLDMIKIEIYNKLGYYHK